jgi:tetratricopeptide (TPR) repeat protein
MDIYLIPLIFALLILLSASMFFYVQRKKRAQNNKLDVFSMNIRNMLAQKTPDEKLTALHQLIARIESDTAYSKTPDWKSKVLVKVYEQLASVHYAMENELDAIAACSRIIELDASNGMAYYNRASMYSNRKEYDKALADFDGAAALMPLDANIHNNRGLVFAHMGRTNEALRDFDCAISLNPSATAYFNRANLYYGQKRYTEARQDYLKCLELDAGNKFKAYAEETIKRMNADSPAARADIP